MAEPRRICCLTVIHYLPCKERVTKSQLTFFLQEGQCIISKSYVKVNSIINYALLCISYILLCTFCYVFHNKFYFKKLQIILESLSHLHKIKTLNSFKCYINKYRSNNKIQHNSTLIVIFQLRT